MGGVSKGTYWAAVFIWDLCILGLFTIAAGLIIFGNGSYEYLFYVSLFNIESAILFYFE